jgi:hypothetical protein
MKHTIKVVSSAVMLMAVTIIALVSCKDDDPPADPNITFMADMTGAKESDPNASTATGHAVLVYNDDTNIFTITVTYAGITPTAGHIHKGAVGVSGNVIFPFPSVGTSPITYTSTALTAEQEADLKAGLYYVNLHSTTYPGGEIRGQLTRQ